MSPVREVVTGLVVSFAAVAGVVAAVHAGKRLAKPLAPVDPPRERVTGVDTRSAGPSPP